MAPSGDRIDLRATFDEVAELYDRARPGYPPELFDDLVALAGLGPASRVLEIGCGTGQATIPLVERGLDMTCLELGQSLAAVARQRLAGRADVVVGDFDVWDPQRAGFVEDELYLWRSVPFWPYAVRLPEPVAWRLWDHVTFVFRKA